MWPSLSITHTQEVHIYTYMCRFVSICKTFHPQNTHTKVQADTWSYFWDGLHDTWAVTAQTTRYQCLWSLFCLWGETLPGPATQIPEEKDNLGCLAWNGAKKTTPKPELSEVQGLRESGVPQLLDFQTHPRKCKTELVSDDLWPENHKSLHILGYLNRTKISFFFSEKVKLDRPEILGVWWPIHEQITSPCPDFSKSLQQNARQN